MRKHAIVKEDGRRLIYYRFGGRGMRVLVTGGAGYIGSIVVEELLAAGARVTVLDNLSRGHRVAVLPDAELVVADLADREALDRVFTGGRFDAVIHMAGFIEVGESVREPARYFRNNLANALNLLEAMLAQDVRRIVFSSTAAVYGQPDTVPITEHAPLRPTNPYGHSKLAFERALECFDRAYGLRYAALRYFNAAGASERLGEDHHPETHLIPNVLRVALGQAPHVVINGTDYPTVDGTCLRDYIHVTDLAAAHVLALDALDEGSVVYNLGNGNGFSVRQVIEAAREVTGHPIPMVAGPRRPGDPPSLVASSERLIRDLGWRPRFADLQTIIRTAWEWRQRHPDGYAHG